MMDKSEIDSGAAERLRATREGQRHEQLRAEASYHRQRLEVYRARFYGGRARNPARLEEFQRVSDEAAARLQQAREASGPRGRGER
jgi:hypothetical protein